MQENIIQHNFKISRRVREQQNGNKSLLVWFTGLSGSGKSTIANRVEEKLFQKKYKTYILDGDNIRSGINSGLSFTREDREENLRRVAEVAKLFVDAGTIVLAAFVSPLIRDRKKVEEIVGEDDFIEVFVNTPLELCEKRDVKGLYKKAREGKILNFTGISAPYEKPKNADIEIDTKTLTIEESSDLIVNFIIEKINYNGK